MLSCVPRAVRGCWPQSRAGCDLSGTSHRDLLSDPTDALGCSIPQAAEPPAFLPFQQQKAGAMQEVCGPRSATCRQRPSQPLLPHQEGDLHLSQVKIHSSNALAARISVQDISCCLCPSEHSWALLQPGAAPEPPNHGKNEIKSSQRACGAGQHVHTIHRCLLLEAGGPESSRSSHGHAGVPPRMGSRARAPCLSQQRWGQAHSPKRISPR